jgi:RNA polymerase sigma-70 factor (ECF subfamily)
VGTFFLELSSNIYKLDEKGVYLVTDYEILLIKRSKKGDTDSFEELISNYQLNAYNIAFRMLGNQEDAKDCTQDALIKVYKSIGKFKGNSSFSTWLYRIVTNTCKDFIRKKKEVLYLDNDIKGEEGNIKRELRDEGDTPETVLEKSELKEVVTQAISELNEDHREVIVLRDINGYSYDEIAEILNCSHGTVKSRINRGRKALKEVLLKKYTFKGLWKEGYNEL